LDDAAHGVSACSIILVLLGSVVCCLLLRVVRYRLVVTVMGDVGHLRKQ